MQELHTRVATIFAEIVAAYNFADFTLDDFASWLAQRRGRPIEFYPLPPTIARKENLMGFWAIVCGVDTIVYLQNTLPLHQLHIQLHELAHILCGHTTAEFDEWDQLLPYSDLIRARKESALPSSKEESEAETLACLLFDEIQRHRRRQRFVSTASANPALAHYWYAMERA